MIKRYWNEHEAHESCEYLHALVENVYQRYHMIYLEKFASQLDSRSYKESLYNSTYKMFLDLCYHQKSLGLGTQDSPNLQNQEQKDHTQTY